MSSKFMSVIRPKFNEMNIFFNFIKIRISEDYLAFVFFDGVNSVIPNISKEVPNKCGVCAASEIFQSSALRYLDQKIARQTNLQKPFCFQSGDLKTYISIYMIYMSLFEKYDIYTILSRLTYQRSNIHF